MTYVIYETIMLVFRIVELMALVSIILSWVMPMAKIVSRIQIPLDFSYLFMLIGIDVARAVVARLLGFII